MALVALMGASSTSSVLAFNDGRGSRVLRGAGDGNEGGLKAMMEVAANRGLAPTAPLKSGEPLPAVTIHPLAKLYLSKTPAPLAISPDDKVRPRY